MVGDQVKSVNDDEQPPVADQRIITASQITPRRLMASQFHSHPPPPYESSFLRPIRAQTNLSGIFNSSQLKSVKKAGMDEILIPASQNAKLAALPDNYL